MDIGKEFKLVAAGMGVLWLVGLLLTGGIVAGVIYFIFWCLKHFGVI